MKIHSSSLNFSAIGANRYQVGKQDGRPDKNASASQSTSQQTKSWSADELKKAVAETEQNKENSLAVIKVATDFKTLKALNAYIHELNQPLQDQSQLVSGIDTYA